MATSASSNPTSENYEKYLQKELEHISEKMQLANMNFSTTIRCYLQLIMNEGEGSNLRVTIQTYLEQLGNLTDNQKQINNIKWLNLTTHSWYHWADEPIMEGLDEIAKKCKDTFTIAYNLHCQTKDKLDQLPDSTLKQHWVLLLVQLMVVYETMSEASELKGLRREIKIKTQWQQPNLHQPE